jgi:hypothetical protein
VPGKKFEASFEANSVVEFFRSGQEEIKQGRVRRRKTGRFAMTFTGTLIEDLMATVERAEQRAQSDGALLVEPLLVEPLLVEPLLAEGSAVEPMFVEPMFVERMFVQPMFVEPVFASVQENADYDSKISGVA